MKRAVMRIQDPDVFTLKGDTQFEFTSDGTPELFLGGAAPQTATAKVLVKENLNLFDLAVFDPTRRKDLYTAGVVLENIIDASRGISPTLQPIAQPNNATMIEPALRAVLKARGEISLYSPLAAQQITWDKVEVRLEQLEDLEQERKRLVTRLENLVIRQAHTRQIVYGELDNMRKLLGPVYEAHRGLNRTLEPLTELFYGPAEQAVGTKKVVKRALDEASAKKDGAKAEDKDARAAAEPHKPQAPGEPTTK